MNDPRPEHASWLREGDGAHDTTIDQNWLFRLGKERFRSQRSGKTHDYYVMHLADAVHAIAITPDDELVMVRQFRAGSARDSLETPGGLLEPGEDPCEAGARELLEETGYAGDPAVLLGTIWSVPSILTSRLSTILITNARRVAEPALDPNEEVTVERIPAATVADRIRNGEIDHALTVVGLFWWLATRPGGFQMPQGR